MLHRGFSILSFLRHHRILLWGSIFGVVCIGIVCSNYLDAYTVRSDQTVLLDSNGTPVVGEKKVPFQTLSDIPQELVALLVGIEDKRFYAHHGIDFYALLRALFVRITAGKIQGASTIEQQLIKLDREQFTRTRPIKIQEMWRALSLQWQYTKEAILLAYFNTVHFSNGVVGRKAACQSYRGVACHQVSPAKRYLLLAIAQRGANPYRESEKSALLARAQILCYAYGKHDCATINTTLWNELTLLPVSEDPRLQALLSETAQPGATAFSLPVYDKVKRILSLTKDQREHYNISDCCVMVLDADGNIVTANQCRSRQDPLAGKIDMCRIPRQTGSAIKPFLYMFAMKTLGYGRDSTIIDEPVQFDLGGGNLYDPKNFDLKYHGEVSLAYALGNSLNVPAIKLLSQVGVDAFHTFLQQLLQATSDEPINAKTAENVGLSLALGTYETSPYAFTQLWRVLLPEHAPVGFEKQQTEVAEILENPINKLVSFGQDSFLTRPGRAVKTGTSRKFIDARICGASHHRGLTACIWMGNQDNSPMLGPSSTVASYTWSLLLDILEGK